MGQVYAETKREEDKGMGQDKAIHNKGIENDEIAKFLRSKGFKKKSIRSYISTIKKATMKLGNNFKEEDLEKLFTNWDLKPRTYNNYRTIMNFYTKKYLGYELKFTKAKVDKSLPTYVSREEINLILKNIPNIKHKLAFALMYSSGLRVYEVCRIKKHNLYFDDYKLFIKGGKGGKDRWVFISHKIIKPLRRYCDKVNKIDNGNPYLFQTYRGHISERSFQERLNRAVKEVRLTKKFGCHSLRHSFAINFLNEHNDMDILQKLLGHSNVSTTQIYSQCRTIDFKRLAMT